MIYDSNKNMQPTNISTWSGYSFNIKNRKSEYDVLMTSKQLCSLLGSAGTTGHTADSALAASGLGVLATDTAVPVVTDTTVSPNLFQPGNILTACTDQSIYN
jgi:hypothetical protein